MTKQENGTRWSVERAQEWHRAQPWILGCNFLPSSAVNFVDMWHPQTFDAETIDRELGWAAKIGMNAVRVNLQYVLWRDLGDAHKEAFDAFLEIAARHNIRVMPCLFDDCGFGGLPANSEVQPDPVPGVHNSRALASPGREIVMDESQWPDLLAYVSEVVGLYGDDDRILLWDLYNEPGNLSVFDTGTHSSSHDSGLVDMSLELCRKAFVAARSVNPSQPISSGAWKVWRGDDEAHSGVPFQNEIDQALLTLSDVITFHAYVPVAEFETVAAYLGDLDRPLMCTEWMARTAGSRIEEQLPLMAKNRIGAFQWGLVQGRTQTHIPWPSLKADIPDYDESTTEWFHDVFRPDGTAYLQDEISVMEKLASSGGK